MKKTVIFDLSDVFIGGMFGIEKLAFEALAIPPKEFLHYQRELNSLFMDAMRGYRSEDDYWTAFLRNCDKSATLKDDLVTMKKLVRQNFCRQAPGMAELLSRISRQHRIVILSDHLQECATWIEHNMRILKNFDQVLFSYELGMLKSDEGMFECALEVFDCKPKDTLFIDDWHGNTAMAEKVGIKSLVFTGAKATETWLADNGVEVIQLSHWPDIPSTWYWNSIKR